MTISALAGKPATREMLVDLAQLEREYYACVPDPDDAAQRVSFGTSGHRGSSPRGSFTEAHILVITQAICDHRRAQRIATPEQKARLSRRCRPATSPRRNSRASRSRPS